MFLALKNGLGRLAVFFRGLLDEYGGASAAYSLRRLYSGYSGPIVKVRRDADLAELDFTSTTSIEDWVNGKLETTLPCDVATSAAAYSLRKVKADYAGDAVRIRRASDDVEVDVAFDANDEVSTSSAITNVTESPDQGDTTETTLGGFLTEGGNQDANVVTWYDQSGNGNDATQDTAGNQPKIAEAGSLLGELDFDGVDDRLDLTNLGLFRNVGYGQVFTVVTPNRTLTGSNRYFEATTGTTGARFLLGDSQDFASSSRVGGRRLDGDSFQDIESSTSHGNNETLITAFLNWADSDAYLYFNGTEVASSTSFQTSGNTSDTDSAVAAIGGATAFGDFSMKEIIIYNSDQSDNRFKIESNINNHYGLYNDANEFDASETSFRFLQERVGGTSTSSDLTGFTLDVQTASAYAGAKFSTDVASGDSIYVSFDCSFDAGSPSPKVGLRNVNSSLSGALHSNEGLIVGGFNSFALTSTSDSASGIVFSEGDDNVIFTISNLKVSRIARDGFVRTWYDQAATNYPIPALSAPQQNVSNQYETFTNASATGVTAGNTSGSAFAGFDFSGSNGDTVIVEFDFTVNSGSPSPTFQLKDSNYAVGKSNNQIVSSTGSYQIRFDANSDFDSIGFSEGDIGEFTISNFRVIRFYNGNDATQSTQNDQPKIVNAGSYLGELDFDGVNSKMDIVGFAPVSLTYSAFTVATIDNPTATSLKTIFDSTDLTNGGFAVAYGNTASKFTPFWFDGDDTSPNVFSAGADLTNAKALYSVVLKSGASTTHIDGTLNGTILNTWITAGSNTFTKSTIGYDQTTPGRSFDGKLGELVIYESDQSANRSAIESNIADEYGITLP